MTSIYNLSQGKAKLVSNEHMIYSSDDVNSLDPYYLILKTKTAFYTYKTKECKEKGMKIPADVKVKIESITILNDYDAYKIRYNGRIGYVKPSNIGETPEYFKDLEYFD